jgi:hypothetical protein
MCIPQDNPNREVPWPRIDRSSGTIRIILQATCRMGALTSASYPSQTLLVVSVPQRDVRSYRGPPDEHITSWRVPGQLAIGR